MEHIPQNSDMIIDLLGAAFYLAVIVQGAFSIWINKHKGAVRINVAIAFLMAVAILYIYQTIVQLSTGFFPQPRVWDILNFIQAVGSLMAIQLLSKGNGTNLKQHGKNIPSGGLL